MDQMKSGKLIAQLRKEKGMTQKELGQALGVSDRAVSNWERGVRFPDVALLEDISEQLEISVLELLRGEREETKAMQSDELDKTVREVLSRQKKELRHDWLRVTIISVLCTVMICLGGRYAWFLDRVLFLNLIHGHAPATWLGVVIALLLGGIFRFAMKNSRLFYSAALGLLTLWFLCETVSAVIFQHDILSLAALAGGASRAGWLLMWGMFGAWLTHGALWLWRRIHTPQ